VTPVPSLACLPRPAPLGYLFTKRKGSFFNQCTANTQWLKNLPCSLFSGSRNSRASALPVPDYSASSNRTSSRTTC
jgi:hypothetical protein